MGSASSKPETKEGSAPTPTSEFSLTDDSALEDREVAATHQWMLQSMNEKTEAADAVVRGTFPSAIDNSAFPYEYYAESLPLDEDGFAHSFAPDDTEGITQCFDRYGVVVVRDVLTAEECKRSQDDLWSFVERHSSARRDRPETYHFWPSLSKVGILGNTIILGTQVSLNRQLPPIHNAFAALFRTERLHVAVMRASVMRPTRDVRFPKKPVDVSAEEAKGEDEGEASEVEGPPATGEVEYELKDMPEWKSISKWLHWDCNPWTGMTTTFAWKQTSLSANCGYDQLKVQGILAVADCPVETGGFHCVPGFHKHLRGWAHANRSLYDPTCTDTTVQVPKGDPMRADIQKCPIRAGSLLIWNSAIPHANFPNDGPKPRLVQYIKMAPVDDPSVSPVFTDESVLPPEVRSRLTPLGRRLHGFDEW